jgi:hypothetical protein
LIKLKKYIKIIVFKQTTMIQQINVVKVQPEPKNSAYKNVNSSSMIYLQPKELSTVPKEKETVKENSKWTGGCSAQ